MKNEGGNRFYKNELNTDYPLVSIIVVTYNAAPHLQNCIDSITGAHVPNIELLIFDGASTDKTVEIIEHNENNISYWQSERDSGIYNAMNKALDFAKGKWILFLGSDDKLMDGFREMTTNLKDESCIYYGDYVSNNKRYGGIFTTYRLAKANFCQQNVLYTNKVFKKYRFNEKYKISADHLLNMQCWADKSFRFEYHSCVIADFSSKGISSIQIDTALEADKEGFIKKYLGKWAFLRYKLKKSKTALKQLFRKPNKIK